MKRIAALLPCIALVLAMGGCTTGGDTGQGTSGNAGSDKGKDTAAIEQAAEDGPVQGLVDAKTGAYGPVIVTDRYSTGIHHAMLTIKGYEPMEIEIYSDNAPQTSALFCKLVREGYYNGLRLNTLMPNLYATLGAQSSKVKKDLLVEGEFEEAGFKSNHIGLKRGVIAMSRYDDPALKKKNRKSKSDDSSKESECLSDASSLYVFLTNASYLDGKYAGFAKITSGINTFAEICEDVAANAKIKDDGTIAKKKKQPIIKKIVLED